MQTTNPYAEARQLALEIRAKYGLTSPRVMVSDLKQIYRKEGIDKVDYWDKFKGTRLKGAYFNDEYGKTVVINKKIIKQIEPKVFTMAHELKHHLLDKVVGVSFCNDDNEKDAIEKAADAFASELIYPTQLFTQHMSERNIEAGKCTTSDIVKLKHETKTTLSHTALALKASRLSYCTTSILEKPQWHKLRDQLYPEYTRFRKVKVLV
jgi:Zn-dependent peptidase ImmA (M78 family)